MAINIISNHAANMAQRNLAASQAAATRSLEKLSAGARVLSARDDTTSYSIGTRLNATLESLKTAGTNVGQANSMLQIADGALETIDSILVRMNTLALKATSENLAPSQYGLLNEEFTQLRDQITQITASTNFNGVQLLGDNVSVSFDKSDLKAGGSADALAIGNGFSNIEITDNSYWATDGNDNGLGDNRFSIDLAKVGNRIMMVSTAEIDGAASDSSQSIDVTDYITGGAKELATGESTTLSFADVGVKVRLNANIATTIANALAQGSDGAGADGNTANQIFGSTPVVSVLADQGEKLSDKISFQIGPNNAVSDRLAISLDRVDPHALGTGSNGVEESLADLGGNAISSPGNAKTALKAVARAIDDLQRARSNVGTYQNRLDFATNSLSASEENVKEARSKLLDLDVAAEMTNFMSHQLLMESGVAMLAQANQRSQDLLRYFER